MNPEEYLSSVLLEIIKENKIPLTERGLAFLQKEVTNRLIDKGYEINIQPVSELSGEDRRQRATPRIEIILK